MGLAAEFPWFCTCSYGERSDHAIEWLEKNMDVNRYCIDFLHDAASDWKPSTVWFGFKQREDLVRFQLICF